VLGYRDKVRNFQVFNGHALSPNPLCFLVDSQGNVRTYYRPCGCLIPKKSAFQLASLSTSPPQGQEKENGPGGHSKEHSDTTPHPCVFVIVCNRIQANRKTRGDSINKNDMV
jgi:hypothetical protein